MNGLINALSVALTILFGLLLVYALVMMIVPQLITSVTTLYYTARNNLNDFVDWASHQEIIASNQKLLDFIETSYDNLQDTLDNIVRTKLVPSMQSLLSGAALGVMSFVTFLKNIIIGVIVSVYLLASRKKFGQQGKMILYSLIKPRWADIILEEILYADKMFGGFINGKILDSAIIGVLCYIACLIFKFPSALLVSVIIGVTNVIPFFGPFIGAIPATLLILIQNPIKALWFVLFVLVLQQVDGNIIGPKILGNTTGLSSFWVLFSILLFGGLWGFVGMIVGVPLFAVIYDVIKKLVIHGLQRHQELTLLNEMAMILGLVFMTTGTFLGAVWANESWGRYWGWDPKETWALISVVVYALVLHIRFIPGLSKSIFVFNMCSVWAIASVLMTYFGVNYYLSGLHSYGKSDAELMPWPFVIGIVVMIVISVLAGYKYKKIKLTNE